MNIKQSLYNYFILTRLNKPYAIMLLVIPCFLGLALSSFLLKINNLDLLKYYVIFFIGSIVMRSFGCIVNDYFDKDIDKQVERTKNRPLASGAVSTIEALFLLIILGSIGLYLLTFLSKFAILVAVSSLILVIIYPLSKRFFKVPQLVLGLAFNWGVLVAGALFLDTINLPILILFISLIFWTLAYDTIYAYQDYEDDKKLNIYSLTLLLHNNYKKTIAIFYLLTYKILFMLALYIKLSLFFYIFLTMALVYILVKLYKLNKEDTKECFNFFKDNIYYGLLIWIGLLLA